MMLSTSRDSSAYLSILHNDADTVELKHHCDEFCSAGLGWAELCCAGLSCIVLHCAVLLVYM